MMAYYEISSENKRENTYKLIWMFYFNEKHLSFRLRCAKLILLGEDKILYRLKAIIPLSAIFVKNDHHDSARWVHERKTRDQLQLDP